MFRRCLNRFSQEIRLINSVVTRSTNAVTVHSVKHAARNKSSQSETFKNLSKG